MRLSRNFIALAVSVLAVPAAAETVTIAVASNFAPTAAELSTRFEETSGHTVRLVRGSSGKLYAQIVNGAPFDVFLSGDRERPERLERAALIVDGSRYTYAVGQLVVWSADEVTRGDCLAALETGDRKVAIANPSLAPYGIAAQAFLSKRGWWEALQTRLVYGENVSQAAQFVATGNAVVGVLAASQLGLLPVAATTCLYRVPAADHAPIEQQAVQLKSPSSGLAAGEFLRFLKSAEATAVIERHGYRVGMHD